MDRWKPQTIEEARREEYQVKLEMEMLTEGRMPYDKWIEEALAASRAYQRVFPSNPMAASTALSRIRYYIFSIAEVNRAAKERWAL